MEKEVKLPKKVLEILEWLDNFATPEERKQFFEQVHTELEKRRVIKKAELN